MATYNSSVYFWRLFSLSLWISHRTDSPPAAETLGFWGHRGNCLSCGCAWHSAELRSAAWETSGAPASAGRLTSWLTPASRSRRSPERVGGGEGRVVGGAGGEMGHGEKRKKNQCEKLHYVIYCCRRLAANSFDKKNKKIQRQATTQNVLDTKLIQVPVKTKCYWFKIKKRTLLVLYAWLFPLSPQKAGGKKNTVYIILQK